MSEVDYLADIYRFDDSVMAKLEAAAFKQSGPTWPEYVKRSKLPEVKRFQPKDGKPIEVLDINPGDYDATIVYHMPMGCLLDANTMMHLATLADAEPNKRIISTGNPGQPGRSAGKLSLRDSLRVYHGDFRPVVGPTLEYLHSQAIDSSIQSGVSYGADKVAATGEHANRYDHLTPVGIMTEPTSVQDISVAKLGWAFGSTTKYAGFYGERIPGDVFKDAQDYKESQILYPVGLGRLSNLAIAHGLAHSQFEDRLTRAMIMQARMRSVIFWGTKSELAINDRVEELAGRLRVRFHKSRVVAIPLEGQRHAMNVDPFINSALILQGLVELDKAITSPV